MISKGLQDELEREASRWELAAKKHEEEGNGTGAMFARDQAKAIRGRLRDLTKPRPSVRFA